MLPGASSSAAIAATTAAHRARSTRLGPSAIATAAIPPITISSAGTHSSCPGYWPSTASSVTIPATIAAGPRILARMPPLMATPTPAPTSAAVNGAS
jgi:hypothetical protein